MKNPKLVILTVASAVILFGSQRLGMCGDLSTVFNASVPILKALGEKQQQDDEAEAARLQQQQQQQDAADAAAAQQAAEQQQMQAQE
jgi:hypothetical protein